MALTLRWADRERNRGVLKVSKGRKKRVVNLRGGTRHSEPKEGSPDKEDSERQKSDNRYACEAILGKQRKKL